MNGVFSKKKRKLPHAFLACLYALASSWLFAVDYYLEGEELFRQNNPDEAIPLLYQASLQPDVNPNVFVYLGLCYHQVGRYDEAVSTFMRGTLVNGADTKTLFFNAGNVYFDQQLFQQAEDMYTRSIQANSAHAPAFLNRANTRMMLQKLDEAVQDYSAYITLNPATWQKDSIMELIAMINRDRPDIAAGAGAGGAAAGAGGHEAGYGASGGAGAGSGAGWLDAQAEAERAAAEERFRLLMDEVTASLQAVEGASIFSSGAESVMGYDEEGVLE